ncbi:MAG: hypothetical protein KA988_04835 [Longilinea sp.]|nr:hypothetical protein [Longilinea sp.]MCA1953784.1 hypothetical protein [Anaerolinea sp.]
MKKCMLVIFLTGLLLAGCAPKGDAGREAVQSEADFVPGLAMKGYELYSWQQGAEWQFALLPGTNREKTEDEVRAAAVSLEALQDALAQLPQGEQIFWLERTGFPLPDLAVREAVQSACAAGGLELSVVER